MSNRILPIYIYNNKVLREKCEDIDVELMREHKNLSIVEFMDKYGNEKDSYCENIKNLLSNMENTLRHNLNAIGLSSNQVGSKYNVFMFKVSGNINCVINPKIIKQSDETIKLQEGCLSFPKLLLNIERPIDVHMEFFDRNFLEDEYNTFTSKDELDEIINTVPKDSEEELLKLKITEEYKENYYSRLVDNRFARILLHEYDHLQGKLFIDFLNEEERKNIERDLDKISKGRVGTKYNTIN